MFTTDNNEVSHKVSERAAFYIGGNSQAKTEIYKTIKLAYNIRSKYLHGQTIKAQESHQDYLQNISTKVDSLIRQIFTKVIMKDMEIFKDENDRFRLWLEGLIFA